jgi:uncharacterized phage infection (PIP) family protein YhgE
MVYAKLVCVSNDPLVRQTIILDATLQRDGLIVETSDEHGLILKDVNGKILCEKAEQTTEDPDKITTDDKQMPSRSQYKLEFNEFGWNVVDLSSSEGLLHKSWDNSSSLSGGDSPFESVNAGQTIYLRNRDELFFGTVDSPYLYQYVVDDQMGERSKVTARENDKNLKRKCPELTSTEEELASIKKELKRANDELKHANDQLKRANDQLKRANEDLKRANEDLKRANEELVFCKSRKRRDYVHGTSSESSGRPSTPFSDPE